MGSYLVGTRIWQLYARKQRQRDIKAKGARFVAGCATLTSGLTFLRAYIRRRAALFCMAKKWDQVLLKYSRVFSGAGTTIPHRTTTELRAAHVAHVVLQWLTRKIALVSPTLPC